jgi:hypothetical protein
LFIYRFPCIWWLLPLRKGSHLVLLPVLPRFLCSCMGDAHNVFPTDTLRVQLLIKFLENPSIFPVIFHVFNVFNISLLQQVSYALKTSSYSIAEYSFLRMVSMMSVFNIFCTSVVGRFFLNPYCCSCRRFLSSSTCMYQYFIYHFFHDFTKLVDCFLVVSRLCLVLE